MNTSLKNHEVLTRLKKAEGQVRGIINMIESERACEDVLIQILGVQGALNKIGKTILKSHLNSCVKESIEKGETEMLCNFNSVLDKFID